MIYRVKVSKTPASQLSAEIQRIFKTSKTRADLIAVDQLVSLNMANSLEKSVKVKQPSSGPHVHSVAFRDHLQS